MRQTAEYTILSAQGAAVLHGKAAFCKDYRHAIFSFATDGGGNANLTVKFQGAISTGASATDAAPQFSDSQSATNMWDYVEVVDLEDGTTIDGDTGIVVAGADDYRLVEMNINGLEYVSAIITARSAGTVTSKLKLFND